MPKSNFIVKLRKLRFLTQSLQPVPNITDKFVLLREVEKDFINTPTLQKGTTPHLSSEIDYVLDDLRNKYG